MPAIVNELVAEIAITLLNRTDSVFFPLTPAKDSNEVAYVGIGIDSDNVFAKRMRSDYNAGVFYFNYKQDSARILSLVELIKARYKSVVIGVL